LYGGWTAQQICLWLICSPEWDLEELQLILTTLITKVSGPVFQDADNSLLV
jgi:hypothetical protein